MLGEGAERLGGGLSLLNSNPGGFVDMNEEKSQCFICTSIRGESVSVHGLKRATCYELSPTGGAGRSCTVDLLREHERIVFGRTDQHQTCSITPSVRGRTGGERKRGAADVEAGLFRRTMQLFQLHWSGMPDFTGRCPPPSVSRSTSSESRRL